LQKQTQLAQRYVEQHGKARGIEIASQFREFISRVALSSDDWGKVVALLGGEERKFMPGQAIRNETDPFEHLMYIANGEVAIECAGLRSHVLSVGGVLGILEFLGNKKRHAESCML
jgi:hypothetical protein